MRFSRQISSELCARNYWSEYVPIVGELAGICINLRHQRIYVADKQCPAIGSLLNELLFQAVSDGQPNSAMHVVAVSDCELRACIDNLTDSLTRTPGLHIQGQYLPRSKCQKRQAPKSNCRPVVALHPIGRPVSRVCARTDSIAFHERMIVRRSCDLR
jgi:hypothetical protein